MRVYEYTAHSECLYLGLSQTALRRAHPAAELPRRRLAEALSLSPFVARATAFGINQFSDFTRDAEENGLAGQAASG